ncbi:hypothetical protein GGI07_005823 [Coemansia sp. Benny D115]|nr:hypothetical protein GGI07_005823 [Coemansia sp. Benny D115]
MERIEHQAQIESVTEDIMTDRQLLEDYSRKLGENKDALKHIQESVQKVGANSRLSTMSVNMGDFFIQMPNTRALSMAQGAQEELEKAIVDTQGRLEKNTEVLAKLKGKK